MASCEEMLHAGELKAQARYEQRPVWPAETLERFLHTALDDDMIYFLRDQSFFFLSTADERGNCDCSFKGSERNADGSPQPCVGVLGRRTLVWPDFRGNKLYNSLGNILANPRVGLLFINFPSQRRLRLNGGAEILDNAALYADVWPLALRYVRMTVEQAYWNCGKRIPACI